MSARSRGRTFYDPKRDIHKNIVDFFKMEINQRKYKSWESCNHDEKHEILCQINKKKFVNFHFEKNINLSGDQKIKLYVHSQHQ